MVVYIVGVRYGLMVFGYSRINPAQILLAAFEFRRSLRVGGLQVASVHLRQRRPSGLLAKLDCPQTQKGTIRGRGADEPIHHSY
jgi:hypothetical protein